MIKSASRFFLFFFSSLFALGFGGTITYLILFALDVVSEPPNLGYVLTAIEDTGSINVVTAILLDYRGFDTLGEATVIFTSVAVTASILGKPDFLFERPVLNVITQRAIGFLLPIFFMFPLYIITHGHLSPGGGFQGGVSLAVLVVLLHVVYGHQLGLNKVPIRFLSSCEYWAALSFGLVGLAGLFHGVGYLANLSVGFPQGTPGSLVSGGLIPLLNLIVGIKVAAGLSGLYITLAGNVRKGL